MDRHDPLQPFRPGAVTFRYAAFRSRRHKRPGRPLPPAPARGLGRRRHRIGLGPEALRAIGQADHLAGDRAGIGLTLTCRRAPAVATGSGDSRCCWCGSAPGRPGGPPGRARRDHHLPGRASFFMTMGTVQQSLAPASSSSRVAAARASPELSSTTARISLTVSWAEVSSVSTMLTRQKPGSRSCSRWPAPQPTASTRPSGACQLRSGRRSVQPRWACSSPRSDGRPGASAPGAAGSVRAPPAPAPASVHGHSAPGPAPAGSAR